VSAVALTDEAAEQQIRLKQRERDAGGRVFLRPSRTTRQKHHWSDGFQRQDSHLFCEARIKFVFFYFKVVARLMGISQYKLAKDISVPPRRINEIVQGKRSITANTALRLSRYFGLSERFWLNL
jgi:hypothetical protein